MQPFEELLKKSTGIHGHICAGQVIGVRMSMLGLKKIEIDDPYGCDRKKLYVVVEIDRCATDAIQTVTGCSLGKRSLKWVDNGVMAATFVNLVDGNAVRITAREEARELSKEYYLEITDKYKRQLAAYQVMPEDELFDVENVSVDIPECDFPGKPLKRIKCEVCGDWVQDSRDIIHNDKVVCKGCAFGKYYRPLKLI
jgi:formylmethanofuran dehydrogenase subunit E